jgi:hypothetical protein
MSTLATAHVGLNLAMLGVGVAAYRATRGRPRLERLAWATLPYMTSVTAWLFIVTIVVNPILGPWSAARLAPAMALRYGYQIYNPAGVGPVIGWVYPPGSALAYLPAAFVGDVTDATLTGRFLTLLYYIGPVVWLLFGDLRRAEPYRWMVRGLLFVVFAFLTFRTRALLYVATEVHADAPALGLGALAVGFMARYQGGGRVGALRAAMICALASVWAKQLTVTILLLALPLWAWRRGGLRGLWQYVLVGFVAGIGSLLLASVLTERWALVFNIWTVPSRHPWRPGAMGGAWYRLFEFESKNVLLVGAALAGVLGRYALLPGRRTRVTGPDLGPFFLMVGAIEAPLAIIGFNKLGGDDNSMAYALYFLALGVVFMLDRFLDEGPSREDREAATPFVLLVLGVNLAMALVADQQIAIDLLAEQRSWTESRAVESYLRQHRGEVYFPWNPLEHLVVEGQLYHFEYGVYDRGLAGIPLTREHFLRHIPPQTRLVCFPTGAVVGDRVTMSYLPEFTRRVDIPDLPGWTCYARGS